MFELRMSAVIPRDPSPYTEIDVVPLPVLMPWKVSGCRWKVPCLLWIFEKLECWSVFDVYWSNISNGYVNMWGNESFRILSIDIFVLCNWPRCRSYGFFVTIRTVVCILRKDCLCYAACVSMWVGGVEECDLFSYVGKFKMSMRIQKCSSVFSCTFTVHCAAIE